MGGISACRFRLLSGFLSGTAATGYLDAPDTPVNPRTLNANAIAAARVVAPSRAADLAVAIGSAIRAATNTAIRAALTAASTARAAALFATAVAPLGHRGDHLQAFQLQLLPLSTQIESHKMAQVFQGDLPLDLQLEGHGLTAIRAGSWRTFTTKSPVSGRV